MINSTEKQRIEAALQQFGLNSRDAEIYLHSLQVGPASVQRLAHDLGQNRVTVHSAVEKLIELGFLFESRRGKRRLVVAESPDMLHRLVQKRKSELDMLADSAKQISKLLSSVRKTGQSVPTVKFYEGVEGLKKMLEETLSAEGEVLVFTYVDIFSQLLSPHYLESYYIRRAKKGIRARLIFPLGDFGRRVHKRAEEFKMKIRFLSPDIQWRSGIFCWNDIVAIQSFTEGRVTCTIIENEDIAFFFRKVIYELCWEQALPLKTIEKNIKQKPLDPSRAA